MSPAKRKVEQEPRTKKCPACHTECELSAKTCECCGYEFPTSGGPRFKACSTCGALNPNAATDCHSCGASFGTSFLLSLDEALRTGAIVRGMDIEEPDVKEGERIAQPVRAKILRSGDNTLVRIIRSIPDESFARLKDILSSP